MKNIFKSLLAVSVVVLALSSCKKTQYSDRELVAPSDLVLNATVVGADAAHPNGDSSGNVIVSFTGANGISYRVDYDASDPESFTLLPAGNSVTHRYTDNGLHSYTITGKVYGAGGQTTATATKTISVYTKFVPDPAIITNLTNNASKTWAVDKDAAGHFGVGPYSVGSIRPEWYAAGPNEKAACCACFYTATYTFTQTSPTTFTITSTTPNGAFTKTGALAGGLPGIPASGDEACYTYAGGTGAFIFSPATSGAPVTSSGSGNFGSTQTSIVLAGSNTFIGYGAVLKEYEILTIDENYVLFRVQGTETGNAWYLRLKAQ